MRPPVPAEIEMETLTFWNGEWHEGNHPVMGPRDHGLWLASVVFDGGRAIGGCGPDLDQHSARVIRSARSLGLQPTKTAEEILELSHEAVRRFGNKVDLYVRPMFWALSSGAGPIMPDPSTTVFCLCVHVSPMPAKGGLALGLCRTIRRPTPDMAPADAKAACLYPNSWRGVREMVDRGFQNGVVVDANGNVAETCSSNVFIVKDGVAITPIANGTFLAGITRNRTMQLLRDSGVTVEERTVKPQELDTADEIFTTGNAGKVQPVIRYENRDLQPGPVARRAAALYAEYTAGHRIC
jgi:branched-chain amino acid aminotransferase